MAAGKIFAISFAINAMMGAGFTTAMNQGGAAMQRLSEKTKNLNSEQKRLDRAWQESQNQIRAYSRQMQSLQAQYSQGKISESQYQYSMQRISQSMRQAGMSAEEYRGHLARLKAEMNQTQAAAKRLEAAQAGRMAATAKMSAAFASAMGAVSVAGMAASPVIGAVETAANFEAAMSKVQAITGITDKADERMIALTNTARQLGETTQFSATQAAQAMSYLGMAGWDTNQIIGGMPGLLSLAAAGGTDLARTADIVSDDLTAFGLSADKAGHMADVFAVTVTKTNTNVEMLGETMKYAAPVAKAFGASMEETAALAGIMANSGIKASQAGTSLRAGFLRLAGPPKKSAKAMEELGISLSEAQAQQQEAQAALKDLGIEYEDFEGKPRKMSAILGELRDKTAGLSKEQRLATLQAIFGTEAATGWLAVLDAGPEVFDSLVNEMENCDGRAEQMAKTMQDNAKGAWTQFKSAAEGVAISLGTIFLPAITDGIKWMAEAAGGASAWIKENEGLVKSIAEIGAGAVTAFAFFKAFTFAKAAVGYAIDSFTLFSEAVDKTLAVDKFSNFRTQIMSTFQSIGARATKIVGTLRSLGTQAAGLFSRFGLQAVSALQSMGIRIAAAFSNVGAQAVACFQRLSALKWGTVGDKMANAIGGATDRMGNALERGFASMQGKWQAMSAKISNFSMADTAQSASTAMQSKWQGFKNAVVNNMAQAQGAFARGAANIKAHALQAGESVKLMYQKFTLAGAANTAGNALKRMAGAIMSVGRASLAAMFSPLGIAIMAIAGAAYLVYKNWDKVGPFFMELWGRITEAFGNAWTMIQPALAQLGTAFGGLMDVFANAWAALQPAFAQLGATLGNVFASLGPAFSQLGATFAAAFESISAVISANSGVFNVLLSAAETLATFFGGALVGAFIVFANVAVGSVTTAIGIVASVITGAIGIFTGLIQFITGVFALDWRTAWDGIVQIFSSIFSTIGNIADSVLGGIRNTINGIVSSIKGLAGFGGGGGSEIAANARGGIYRKGAFLTTFAEESPEAAIPLDGSQRAIALWQKAGEMLGMRIPQQEEAKQPNPEIWQKAGRTMQVAAQPQQEEGKPRRHTTIWEKAGAMLGIKPREHKKQLEAPQEIKTPALDTQARVEAPRPAIDPWQSAGRMFQVAVPPQQKQEKRREHTSIWEKLGKVFGVEPSQQEGIQSLPKGLWNEAANIFGFNKEGGGNTVTTNNNSTQMAPPAITINLTVNGNAEPNTIKEAVLDAGQRVQRSFEEQMAEFERRKGRLAY